MLIVLIKSDTKNPLIKKVIIHYIVKNRISKAKMKVRIENNTA